MQKISIIIPVYNSEEFLAECLDSILSQSYQEFEIILINDGSKDNSLKICEKYSANDDRIKLFNTENSGVSAARNLGLKNAEGQLILFFDSDDIMPAETLKNHILHFDDDVDMTLGAIRKFLPTGEQISDFGEIAEGKRNISQALNDVFPQKDNQGDWQRYMVNRAYKKDIIDKNNLSFRTDIFYKEDGLFLVQYLACCKKTIFYFPETVYLYRQNPDSATGSIKAKFCSKLLTDIDAHAAILKILKSLNVPADVVERAIGHALFSRRWMLDKIEDNHSKLYYTAYIKSLLKLYRAMGFKYAIKDLSSFIKQKIHD